MQLRAATYNIHRCYGRDGLQDISRVGRVIDDIKPLVIGLQEVESYFEERAGYHQLDYLANMTGMRAIAGPTVLHSQSHYGNSLLTSAKVSDIRLHDLTVRWREPRGILDVDLDVDGVTVRVISTHLGLFPYERRRQTRRLLHILGTHTAPVTLLMGDFNEWLPWGRPLRWIGEWFGHMPAPPTFPTHVPVLALDRIWVKPKSAMREVRVHETDQSRLASDHFPLVMEVQLP